MRILYGITANGNGHLARSGRVVEELRRRGHELTLVVSGSPGRELLGEERLRPYLRFDGFSFAENGGRVSALSTVLASRPLRFLADLAGGIPPGPYELAVTDFEPLVGWYALTRRIPSAGICHMYSFLYPGVPKPPARWFERLAFRWLAPADVMLGIHWHPYHRLVVPPFVEAPRGGPADPSTALVYLPWEDPAHYLPALMAQEGYRFVVYGGGERAEALYREALKARSGGAELDFRRPGREGFQRDLDAAATVIANAGFALAGEALAKGKRLIMKPYAGQLEQEHNAREAERLGFALRLRALDAPSVAAALRAAPAPGGAATSGAPPLKFPAMLPRFVDWLEKGAPKPDEARHRAFWAPDAP